ncbi:transcription elongation factor GreA [Peptostreptococcus faecalis]|uniref:transcription elongation factor GreA n=1 Tax=Peptostreptococcus faecalis TaxID=2045015 RepID=UPI000C7CEEBF|nr:transcription elongation factor GreA [Peptostreptococcus faecalis]
MMEDTNKEIVLTQEGYDKLEEELELLKTTRRKEVAERLKIAISFGDLSENAEYDEAKKEQASLEERIIKLENITRVATIIDEANVDLNIVTIGSTVIIYDKDFDEEVEYTIVGSAEADPYDGKISNESPVGKALLGSKKGDNIEVVVPDGFTRLEVRDIKR